MEPRTQNCVLRFSILLRYTQYRQIVFSSAQLSNIERKRFQLLPFKAFFMAQYLCFFLHQHGLNWNSNTKATDWLRAQRSQKIMRYMFESNAVRTLHVIFSVVGYRLANYTSWELSISVYTVKTQMGLHASQGARKNWCVYDIASTDIAFLKICVLPRTIACLLISAIMNSTPHIFIA